MMEVYSIADNDSMFYDCQIGEHDENNRKVFKLIYYMCGTGRCFRLVRTTAQVNSGPTWG